MTFEFEVSIFGPGKGEAIAVNLGGGDWITVDSCRDQVTGAHPVLRYLEQQNVDIATQVRRVVATHAHDDHVAGISELFARADSAYFVTSAAVTTSEFFARVETDEEIEKHLTKKVRAEFSEVLDELARRAPRYGGAVPLQHADQQKLIWSRPASEKLPAARVLALSPSDTAVLRARTQLAAGLAKVDDRRRLGSADPNEFAVALWVEVGDVSVVLGADLLNGPAGCGWGAVLASHAPTGTASLFKVAHHGSEGAHHTGMWASLLAPDVVAVLAPFRHGRHALPNPADVGRIKSVSSSLYATASPKNPAPHSTVRRTSAALSAIASNVRDPNGRSGHVRARWSGGYVGWSVETFEPARVL